MCLQITSINGTITWDTKGDLNGKIVVSAVRGPHESDIRAFHRKGAIAAIFIRPGTFLPGFGMYIVDGHSRSDLALPTMEATYTKDKHILKLPEGSFVRCLPTENLHKKANDTKFQLIMNLVQSFWELAIIFIACYRIYQFYIDLHSPIFSVAPLCCTLEGIAAALRLVYTVVDPFYTYRILDNTTSIVMVTVSWPFSEAAGILLTFFCTYFIVIGVFNADSRSDSGHCLVFKQVPRHWPILLQDPFSPTSPSHFPVETLRKSRIRH